MCLILLLCLPMMAQERQSLQGKVVAVDAAVIGAFVFNKQSGTEVKTDAWGSFTIDAKANDKLVVYSDKTNGREFFIHADAFKNMPYILTVEVKATQLDEVVVETNTVTSESLGLVPENQKRMTVAERRLSTADSGPLDILLNLLSGKTEMLKRELATEHKEQAMESLNGLINEDEIAAEYGIAPNQVTAFLFYAIEQPNVVAALKSGNSQLVNMLMIETAVQYKALQQQPVPNPQPIPVHED